MEIEGNERRRKRSKEKIEEWERRDKTGTRNEDVEQRREEKTKQRSEKEAKER